MKRRVVFLAMLMILVLALVGCGKEKVTPDVVVGEYKNLEVTLLDYEVTEQDVLNEMYATLTSYATEITDNRTTVELYDVVNVDYEGLLDGVAFENGSATDYNLAVGASGFIDGFDDGLIGAKVGEKVAVNVTFPEDYTTTTLAGKAVVFNVTVNAIKEITDEIVAANTDYETLEAYHAYYTTYLAESVADRIQTTKENDLLDQIVATSTFNVDYTTEVQEYVTYMNDYYEKYATDSYGVTLSEFLYYMYGMTTEEFTAQLTTNRETSLKYQAILLAIADKEELAISDDEYNEGADEMMRTYDYDTVEALEEAYTKEAIVDSLLSDKALQIILESAVVLEN